MGKILVTASAKREVLRRGSDETNRVKYLEELSYLIDTTACYKPIEAVVGRVKSVVQDHLLLRGREHDRVVNLGDYGYA